MFSENGFHDISCLASKISIEKLFFLKKKLKLEETEIVFQMKNG